MYLLTTFVTAKARNTAEGASGFGSSFALPMLICKKSHTLQKSTFGMLHARRLHGLI